MAEQNFRIKKGLEVGTNGEVFITDITDDGFNVGIGSTKPTNKLSVVGSAFISENLGLGVTNPRTKISFGESSVGIDTGKTSLRLFDVYEDTTSDISNNIGFGVNYSSGIGITYLDIASNLYNGGIRIFTGLTSAINGSPIERIGIGSDGTIAIGGTSPISIGTTEVYGLVTLDGKLGFLGNIVLGDDITAVGFGSSGRNIIIGSGAAATTITGESDGNIIIGNNAGYALTSGRFNVFLGDGSGPSIRTDTTYNFNISDNTFIGAFVGGLTQTSFNEFFGSGSGSLNERGEYNLFLGNNTGISSNASYKILIGKSSGIGTGIQTDEFGTPILDEFGNEIVVEFANRFDSVDYEEDKQLAIGINTSGISEYWLLGNNQFNVGIGTTTLSEKLNVGGNIAVSGIVSATRFLGDGSGLSGVNAFSVEKLNDSLSTPVYVTFAENVGVKSIGITTSKFVYIPSTSSVGIGTTNPDYNLTLVGDAKVSGVVTASTYYGNLIFGSPTQGFKPGAVGIVTASSTNEVVNDLNFILGKLVPKPPTTIAGVALTLTGLTGTGLLCAGFTPTNNAGISVVTPTAGTSYSRNTSNVVSTLYITEYGPGDSGTVTGYINAVGVGTTTLASSNNSGTYGALQIANDKDAFFSTRNTGIQSGFYMVYDARIISASAPDGFNAAYIQQISGSNTYTTTKPFWYEDPSTVTAPVLSMASVETPNPSTHTISYSSGIPHYTESSNNAFNYVITCTNATGDMYTTNTFCTTSGATNGFQTPGNKSYTNFNGGTNPPVRNYGVGTGVTSLGSQLPNNTHIQVSAAADKLSTFTATTPYGSSGAVRPTLSETVNIMGTTPTTAKIDEDNILISSLGTGSGNAIRVNAGSTGDNPTPVYTSWTPSSSIATYEAAVVGGVLKHDQTNYSTGFLPIGPDYSSGRSGSQYIQFEIIRSNVSQFKIVVTGTYSGCWVTMPDNSTWTTSLSGVNGWANMFVAYKGSGVPTTSEPGCASGLNMSGTSGTFTCVFGTESSSNDTNNRILVRFKMTSGQSITALSFTS